MKEIVQATPDMWPLVREIRLRSLSSDPRAFGQTWETESTYEDEVWLTRIERAVWYLAIVDETPVGVVACRHEDDAPENELELQAMWVAPDYRNRGLGSKLVTAVLNWATTQPKADTVTLFVSPTNAGAKEAYLSFGFTDTGDRWVIDEEDPESAWLKLAKTL